MKIHPGLQILALFHRQWSLVLSINKIATLLDKPYAYTYNLVKELLKEKLLKKQTVGKASLCSLNLDHPLMKTYLAFLIPSTTSFSFQQIQDTQIILQHKKQKNKILAVTSHPLDKKQWKDYAIVTITPQQFQQELKKENILEQWHIQYGFEFCFVMLKDYFLKQPTRYAP